MSEIVKCEMCQYQGKIETYKASFSAYNDCRCPQCGSTKNEHNRQYQKRLFENMREKNEPNKK